MIVECENCGSIFRLDEALVKEGGSKVKCSLCKAAFMVYPLEPSSDSTDEETNVAEREVKASAPVPSAGGFTGPDREEIDEDGRLEADLDTVYRDVFRESSKGWDGQKEDPSTADHPTDDAHGVFKEVVEGEALSANRPSVNFPQMSDSDEGREAEAPEAPFEPEGVAEEDLDVPWDEMEKGPVNKKKSTVSRVITVILVIFLLILAAAAALVFLRSQWIPPSLSFLKPPVKKQVSDAGVRLLMFKGVSGSFVDTEKAGNLFVIRGEVSSKYRKPRSSILIKGNILDEKGQVIKSQLSYAANTFTDEELKTITYEEIKRAMRNKDGMARQNFNVPPGASIPFMIVFQNLPDNLSEFTVEAVSSSPGS